MSAAKKLNLGRSFRIARGSLTPTELKRVDKALQTLPNLDLESADRRKVRLRKPADNLYSMKVTPEFLLFFRPTSDGIDVLDLIHKDFLKRFHEPNGKAKEQHPENGQRPRPSRKKAETSKQARP